MSGLQGHGLFLKAVLYVRSEVKEPMAAPDGNFLLLEKDGVKKHLISKQEILWHEEVF